MSLESRCPSHESRSLMPSVNKYMSSVVKISLAVDNLIYQDAIQCEKLIVELKVAHEMT